MKAKFLQAAIKLPPPQYRHPLKRTLGGQMARQQTNIEGEGAGEELPHLFTKNICPNNTRGRANFG